MTKSTGKSEASPHTAATPENVFRYCDQLAALGITPTYQKLTVQFNASNDTVGPLLKAWKEARASANPWQMSDALKEMFADAQETMWQAVCQLAQSKLIYEMHSLQNDLKEYQAKLLAGDEVITNLQRELEAAKAVAKKSAEDCLAQASDLHHAQERLEQTAYANQQIAELKLELQSTQLKLHSKELEVEKLLGKIEGLLAARGAV